MQTYDVVIIGGGHNGLTCAAYLGMAGLKVKVLERRSMVGGAAVTEEFCPGFRNSIAAYTVSLLNPKIIADLRLFEHGLKIVERRAQNFLPTLEGRYLLAAEGRTKHGIAKFSAADAERYDAFNRALDASADVLRELVLQPPAFGEVNGKKRVWGHAIGGMGAITQAMARAAAGHGVEIETDAPVREVLIEKGSAVGVVLEDGRLVRAGAVAANVNPKLL